MSNENEEDLIAPLTNEILNSIRNFFEKKDTNDSRITPVALSALCSNIIAFVKSEPTWANETQSEIIDMVCNGLKKEILIK